jgi:hypothetical protein
MFSEAKLRRLHRQRLSIPTLQRRQTLHRQSPHLFHQQRKPITLKQGKSLISGTLLSLNPDGRLNIFLENGQIETFSSGEIDSSLT